MPETVAVLSMVPQPYSVKKYLRNQAVNNVGFARTDKGITTIILTAIVSTLILARIGEQKKLQ